MEKIEFNKNQHKEVGGYRPMSTSDLLVITSKLCIYTLVDNLEGKKTKI